MRIVHTSDWHLGRVFCQMSLLEEQRHVLEQFIGIVREAKADAVVIAGDLYDRAVPPAEAVSLCDDVLCELALKLHVPVIVIAGNHDSPQRIGFGSKLMAAGNVHLAGEITKKPMCVTLGDSYGPVTLVALPYSDPPFVKACFDDDSVRDHDSAMKCCLAHLPKGGRSVLVAHAFVVGGSVSESERPLTVGGAGTVNAEHFAGFSYAALGHLHRPQAINGGHVQYAGSLLKYSFDESSHTKSVNIVEIDKNGAATVERVELKPKRDVRCISGKFEDLLKSPLGNRDDFLQVTLEDDAVIFEAKQRLREVYPNVLELRLASMMKERELSGDRIDHTKADPLQLFGRFFKEVKDQEMTEAQVQAFIKVAAAVNKEEQ